MTRRSIWLAVLALCLAQALAAQCSNDSCLSAIRNAPTGRNATADCLYFLEQAAPTGTPSRRTTTTTVTSTKSVATLTLHRSATVTRKTGQTSPTTSETGDNGNHKRAEVEYDVVDGEGLGYLPGQALQERRVTTSPASTTLPSYATECSSESAYLSACSCLGLSVTTRATAQPVTTKTATAIRTVANITLAPFFANSTGPARHNGTGTGTVASTIYMGRKSGSSRSSRPTTLFTSRVSSSQGASNGSGSRSVSTSSESSTTKPTVHMVTIATVTTTKEPLWVNAASTLGHLTGNTTAAPYTNSTAALATASANITSSSWLNATTSAKYPIHINSTAAWYNGTSTSSPLAGTGTGVVKTTASVKLPIPYNTTASWYNGTSTSFLPLGSGTGVILTTGTGVILTTGTGSPITTTSARIPYPMNTTASWNNGTTTSTFFPLGTGTGVVLTTGPVTYPTTTTSARFPFPVNTTAFWSNGTSTTAPATVRGTGTGTGILVTGTGYSNTSTLTSTTTTSATPTPTEDLTCGETSTPFSLRVSQPGGTFDNWFVHVVGNGLLFTSSQSLASSFSVEGTGHLCAVGYNDGSGRPRIAAVGVGGAGARDDGAGSGDGSGEGGDGGEEGPVWMLRQGTLKAYWEDYKALECTREGGLSCAPANGTSAVGSGWVGCGLQLSLGSDIDVGYGGLNCSSVSLEVVES